MRMRNELWQGCFGYWQNRFIHHNVLTLLLRAIATYHPIQAMLVLVIGNSAVDINLLQNLAISPADCYKQVQRRWAEFQPDLTTQRRHS